MAFWGPLFGAVAGSVVTGLFNRDSQAEANSDNVKLWREQAAYNTPVEQMKRLEAAGLNPNLAYGQVADSKMGTPPNMQGVRYEAPRFSIADYQQVRNMQEQNKLISTQNRIAEQNAELAKTNAEYAKYENQYLMDRKMLKSDPDSIKIGGRIGEWLNRTTNEMQNFNDRMYRWQLEQKKNEDK